MSRLINLLKAIRELGPRQVGLNALYRFGLASGHYRPLTSPDRLRRELPASLTELHPLFSLPTREALQAALGEEGWRKLQAEAQEILAGRVRLFGAEPVELKLSLPGKLEHWTEYERGKRKLPHGCHPDIKFTWEPARFGWAFTLGRAYHLNGDERYAAAFWRNFEQFDQHNPPGMGPQWMSAQEVALRLMAFTWAGQVLASAESSSPERKKRLAEAVAEHARRIPSTLAYAHSQHNNHLLTEAAGLLTAGLALPNLHEAEYWRQAGWKWLNRGLQTQIDGYGEYSQHSTNYHRLMLQVALWVHALGRQADLRWQFSTWEALKRAVHWMLSLLDDASGRVPNLGANDGAYIFPLSICPFEDQRPVLHAAARVFLEYDLPHGTWDEMALWLGSGGRSNQMGRYLGDQLYGKNSWAYLRTAQYNSHPSHADQLHLDVWWRGKNLTPDAGSYLYNGEKPWDNALCHARVHNTVTVNGLDQMRRAGRFLYLDWVNAYRQSLPVESPQELQRVRGRYRGRGCRHTRIVSVREGDSWCVEDELLPLGLPGRKPLRARLHWLLPDWEWVLEDELGLIRLRIKSGRGWVDVAVRTETVSGQVEADISLWRAGERLRGPEVSDPTRGWVSPTYGVKLPALSLAVEASSPQAIRFTTIISLPEEEENH